MDKPLCRFPAGSNRLGCLFRAAFRLTMFHTVRVLIADSGKVAGLSFSEFRIV